MSSGLPFSVLLQMLAAIVPTLLANSIGVVIASTMLTRYPKPAKLLMAGCGLNLAALGSGFALPMMVSPSWIGGSGASIQTFYMITSFVTSMLYAIGLGLIITAVFTDRTRPQPPDENV